MNERKLLGNCRPGDALSPALCRLPATARSAKVFRGVPDTEWTVGALRELVRRRNAAAQSLGFWCASFGARLTHRLGNTPGNSARMGRLHGNAGVPFAGGDTLAGRRIPLAAAGLTRCNLHAAVGAANLALVHRLPPP